MISESDRDSEYPGEHSRNVGLTVACLIDDEELPTLTCLTKGIVYELSLLRKAYNISWSQFYDWAKALGGGSIATFASFKVTVGRIEKKRVELSRNKKHDELERLFLQPFSAQQEYTSSEETGNSMSEAEKALEKEKAKTEELTSRLSKLSVRNVNKRIKRRDIKVAESQALVKQLECDKKSQAKTISKLEDKLKTAHTSSHSLRQRLYRSDERNEATSNTNKELTAELDSLKVQFSSKFDELLQKIECLSIEIEVARQERDELADRLEELESGTIHTKNGQKYVDGVRQCCIELLSMNVATKQIEPVIRSVLRNIASFEVDALPKPSTLSGMLAEMKCIAYQQISDELDQHENLTLHSDGTSKFGEHYGSYQISTESSAYSLGLCDMLTGSADLTLLTLKQILGDLDVVAGVGTGADLLAKIKNTMSDRHIVQKKFNSLLEDYRSEILPTIISDWKELSVAEQDQLSSLNNFFCGMHVLVGMADTASSTLLLWENAHFESTVGAATAIGGYTKSESGIVRLIRTTCKAMGRHGSEQSGVYQPFTTFLKANGISRNPLAPFRGNRFNILFYDAGVIYFISSLIKKFLTEVWQTPNKLLRAVLADVQVPEFIAGCKALGLINKIITGPLWRVIESKDLSILDMNCRYQLLVDCLEKWSHDASPVVSCEAVLFDDFPPSDDQITCALATPSEFDSTVQEILQVLFCAFSTLLRRLLKDHLPGGDLDMPSDQLLVETRSVPNSNVISERDFAKLDRLLREKPNATTLSLEGIILFSNNKTATWLHNKSPEEKEELFRKARKLAPEFKQMYTSRRQQLLEDRAQVLKEKQLALQKLQEKRIKEKEKITEDIMAYGLWQTEIQITEGLKKLKTNADRLRALKCQLDFRKKVLEQKGPKEIFFLTKNRKKLTVDELARNLVTLLTSCSSIPSQGSSRPDLLTASQETLIGKRICHRWKDSDGTEQWYHGNILSLVPGTNDWFNVQYDGEDVILSLNLFLDIEKGDLNIIR